MFFKPVGTGKLTQEVYTVGSVMVNFFIFTDGTDTICFDTGINFRMSDNGLKKLGIEAKTISHVFLTHVDGDHVGGLGLFKTAKVLVPIGEEALLNGTSARFMGRIHNRPLGREYTTLEDGEVLEIGNIRVKALSTPGHTPGSMCYLVNDRCLFTGDTVSLKNGKLRPFSRLLNMDTPLQLHTIEKLAAVAEEKEIYTAHCGVRIKI